MDYYKKRMIVRDFIINRINSGETTIQNLYWAALSKFGFTKKFVNEVVDYMVDYGMATKKGDMISPAGKIKVREDPEVDAILSAKPEEDKNE